MTEKAQNGQKLLIFIVVTQLRLKNIKERRKTVERFNSNHKKVYVY